MCGLNIFNNWKNKAERAVIAQKHTQEMEEKYGEYIRASVCNTFIYSPDFSPTEEPGTKHGLVQVCDTDSVSAIMKYHGYGKEAVLNFASYKNPGGMFLNGSRAQEECLCHESDLFNILRRKPEYYSWNVKNINKSLYLDRALYSKDVVFEKDGKAVLCDVITCASPNKSSAMKYGNATAGENTTALRSRIRFLLGIAKSNRVDTIILGAFGCGVFGQDPMEVAGIFKEFLDREFNNAFDLAVFAIPKRDTDKNYSSFLEVFGEVDNTCK